MWHEKKKKEQWPKFMKDLKYNLRAAEEGLGKREKWLLSLKFIVCMLINCWFKIRRCQSIWANRKTCQVFAVGTKSVKKKKPVTCEWMGSGEH